MPTSVTPGGNRPARIATAPVAPPPSVPQDTTGGNADSLFPAREAPPSTHFLSERNGRPVPRRGDRRVSGENRRSGGTTGGSWGYVFYREAETGEPDGPPAALI